MRGVYRGEKRIFEFEKYVSVHNDGVLSESMRLKSKHIFKTIFFAEKLKF